jgi:putative iron-dependent peroxidase
MPEPQSAIIPEPSESALFLVANVPAIALMPGAISAALVRFPRLSRELSVEYPEARLCSALGIGAELWDKLSPRRRPAGLRPFKEIAAGTRRAPATGGDPPDPYPLSISIHAGLI